MPDKDKKKLSGQALKRELANACRGLIYISETDRPIEPILEVIGEEIPLKKFVSAAVEENIGKIEESPAAAFFDRLTVDHDWHSDENKKNVRKFRNLEKLILEQLFNVKMFRVGRVRVEIYIIGNDSDGNIAGIRTTAVET